MVAAGWYSTRCVRVPVQSTGLGGAGAGAVFFDVVMDPDRSLLDVVGLGQDLEELLDRKVDVLTSASLHSALRDRILAESRPL